VHSSRMASLRALCISPGRDVAGDGRLTRSD
jgi:hypothetical protein